MTKTQFKAYEISKAKEKRMKALILSAMDRYNPDELLEFLYDLSVTTHDDDEMNYKMISLLEYQGYVCIKAVSLAEMQKVEAFIEDMNANPYQLKMAV